MSIQTLIDQPTDRTASVSTLAIGDLDEPIPRRVNYATPTWLNRGTVALWGVTAMSADPEEEVIARLREADQARRRANAHARIATKRLTNPAEALLALLDRPDYQIQISKEALQEILDSYPEDD